MTVNTFSSALSHNRMSKYNDESAVTFRCDNISTTKTVGNVTLFVNLQLEIFTWKIVSHLKSKTEKLYQNQNNIHAFLDTTITNGKSHYRVSKKLH